MIDLSTASKEMVEFAAKSSVENCLSYFRQYGLELDRRVKLIFADRQDELVPTVLARAYDINHKMPFVDTDGVSAKVNRVFYKKAFGLDLSEEALKEMAEMTENEGFFYFNKPPEDVDLIVFQHVRDCRMPLEFFMAHEVWHLLEYKYCDPSENRIIREGTATYVQSRFCRVAPERLYGDNSPELTNTIYVGSANIVGGIVGKKPNPLKSILKAETRKEILAQFNQRILPAYIDASIQRAMKDNPLERKITLGHPAHEAFRQDPTAKNLVDAFKARGYAKSADEIAAQDMERILGYYKKFLSP